MSKSKQEGCLVVGLMSGTSADGIDAVVTNVSRKGQRLHARVCSYTYRRFAPELRLRIYQVCAHGNVGEICELNFLLGEHFARAALLAIRKAGFTPDDIAAIGSHGQTIHHLPRAANPSTLQIGEPAVIAERTGITTIADFRVRDMAAGGQGAPLVPFADWALFTHVTRPRIIQNIGGIANLTFLPAAADLEAVRAWDTGPGNVVLDSVVQILSGGRDSFDRDGRWAARGHVSKSLLAEMMEHPFLLRHPPKTTGREEFGEEFVRRTLARARRFSLAKEDIVATVTAFTARTIVATYTDFLFPALPADDRSKLQIVLGGGGAKNRTLRRMLSEQLSCWKLLTHAEFGIQNGAKEALAFAILAYETLMGRPGNVPSATGARRPVVLGKIVPGNEW